ncbi:DUF4365 domain-containing protein [Chromobacterium piscinae]|uniref:DUF4365 domain-containing protein n=1 Tax=Chromobacterium piscinae TaxID=686831 RepID=UPI003F7F472C
MSEQLTSALPQESESQRIGHLADKCFQANTPNSWHSTSTDGDSDFGYDYQTQIVDTGLVKDIFRVQLKGTTSPLLNAAGTEYSVSISLSTANYYARATEPILLVLCDLSVDINHPKHCPLYYVWIQDDLRRLRESGVRKDQQTVTFHVPVSNKLDDVTDLSGDIARFRELSKIGQRLDIIVESDKPALSAAERAEIASKMVRNLDSKSADLINALVDDSQSSWVEAVTGSLQWHLREASEALRSGRGEDAKRALEAGAKLLDDAKRLEMADYWHQVGRLRSFMLDDAGARDAFEEACKLSGDADRHIVRWAEAELRLRFSLGGPVDFSKAISRLTSSAPAVVGMHARLTAAEGRYDDAIAIADSIEDQERHVARAIILSMQAKWNESISACEAGLNDGLLRDQTRQLFLILRARARFSLALGLTALGDDPETILPLTGPAGMDPALLHSAWDDIAATITALRLAGWPGNVELVADMWCAVAGMLGLQKQALPVMAEAGAARPTLPMLQNGIETLAVQTGDFGLALEANGRQPESDRGTLRRVALLHMAGKHQECTSLMEAKHDSISDDSPMFGYAMIHATFSAEKIIRPDLAARWTQELASKPEFAAHCALFNYFCALSKQLLAKDIALAELTGKYESLGRPLLIGKHLIHELDPTAKEHAEKCVEIAETLKSEQMLDVDDSTRLAQALTTLERWDDLLALSTQALSQFEGNDRLAAIGAIALDKLGRTAEAHELLKGIVDKTEPDDLAISVYIRIASRSGFAEQAISALEQVYASEKNPRRQWECLRHLFRMLHLSDPKNPRLLEIAWAIGEKADQDDEAQEGLFLMTVFAATLTVSKPLSAERKETFNSRLRAYTAKFPNSRILKSASLPENASPSDLLKILDGVTGTNESQRQWRKKIQAELNQGMAPIPYAWRPRHVLDIVSDLPALWEISKQSSWGALQLHLTMALNEWKPVSLATMRSHVPLIDLLSLMIIADLNLLDAVFGIFPKIAIGKATLLELQNLLAPLSGTLYREKLLALQAALKKRFQDIEQPEAEPPTDNSFVRARWSSEEIVEIAKTSRHMIYSDDALFRIYANPPAGNPPSICTLDLLHALNEAGLLSPNEVAKCIGTLCSWRVGLVVEPIYQRAILPSALRAVKSVSEGVDVLMADHDCNALFSGIWNPGKQFGELQGHAGTLLRDLIEDGGNSILSIASLAGFWIGKTKLHKNAPMPVERLATLLIMQAAFIEQPLDKDGARRLWNVYSYLIELVHGDRMDDDKYRHAIQLAGEIAAEIDHQQSLLGERALRGRLANGLTEGTSEHGRFTNAYDGKFMLFALQSQSNPNK